MNILITNDDGMDSPILPGLIRWARKLGNVIFGGRLAEYKYYDMDKVIASALDMAAMEGL